MAKTPGKPIATSKPSKLAKKPVANEAVPAIPEEAKMEEDADRITSTIRILSKQDNTE